MAEASVAMEKLKYVARFSKGKMESINDESSPSYQAYRVFNGEAARFIEQSIEQEKYDDELFNRVMIAIFLRNISIAFTEEDIIAAQFNAPEVSNDIHEAYTEILAILALHKEDKDG